MTLDALLADLRRELKDEAPSVLHSRSVPASKDDNGLPGRETDEGGIGMPFTAAMLRYLSHPDHWGLSRLAMLSIIEVSDWCASVHPVHRRPLFTRTVCSQLVFEAAYLGQELPDLVFLHPEYDIHQLVGMLEKALLHAAEWRGNKFAQWSKVPGEDAPLPERRPYRPAA